MNQTPNVVQGILGSRKAILTLIGMLIVSVLGFKGAVPGHDVMEFIKWTLTAWLGAQAAEDVVGKLKGTQSLLSVFPAAGSLVDPSIPPPPKAPTVQVPPAPPPTT